MADLVTLADAQSYLGVSGNDALLTALLNEIESLFEAECGRIGTPFKAAATTQTEVHDGTGGASLFMDYPIASVASIKLGYDSADPDDTLDPTDVDEVTFAVGSREIRRTDGGVFGRVGQARYVHIVYNHQADLPANAQLAIKRVLGQVFFQRGSEDAKYENIGGYVHNLSHLIAEDPIWKSAVGANQRMVMA